MVRAVMEEIYGVFYAWSYGSWLLLIIKGKLNTMTRMNSIMSYFN